MKRLKEGYSLSVVIIMVTFITFTFSLTTVFVAHYLHTAKRHRVRVDAIRPFYETLHDEMLPLFQREISERICSPYSGWYSELPQEIDGYAISCSSVDALFDVNHIDMQTLDVQLSVKQDKREALQTAGYFY